MKKSATKRGMGPQREDVTAIEDLSLYNRQLSPQPKGHLFIGSRSVQSFLYMLILLYLSLSLLSVASDADYNVFSMCIYSSQLCILAVFMVEQSLKINFFGWRYVKNAWNWLDLIVIFICFLLVIAEFNQFHVSVFKYFQFICILRLLRMVSLYRKLTETKTLLEKKKHSIVVTTASQEVVDILQHIRRSMNNTEIDEKLKWCIQIISENKLHDPKFPIIHPSSHLHAEELLPWIQSFSKEPSRRRSTELMQAPAIQEFSISPESIVLIPEEVNDSLENISSFEFDVFSLQSACSGNELLTLMVFFFTKSHLLGFFPAAQFREWVTAVQEGYKKTNPYHNSTHAADVTQTIHSVLFGCDAAHIFSLHLLDVACCYLAACIHDFQHPGHI